MSGEFFVLLQESGQHFAAAEFIARKSPTYPQKKAYWTPELFKKKMVVKIQFP
jgi:hypothetical protein